jgi:hypothetical protein
MNSRKEPEITHNFIRSDHDGIQYGLQEKLDGSMTKNKYRSDPIIGSGINTPQKEKKKKAPFILK